MKKIFGVAPNAFFLGLVSLFNDFSSEMIYSVMPGFLTGILGAPAFFVGFIEGFADALASVIKVFAGYLSDRLHRRKILSVTGYGISTFTRWILYFVTSIWQVFLLRAIDRFGKGFREAPRDALLSESVERHDLGKSFGFQRAMDTVGSVLGPLAAFWLGYNIHGASFTLADFHKIFLIGFWVGILSLLAFFFVKEIKGVARVAPRSSPKRITLSVSLKDFDPPFRAYIKSIFIFSLGMMPTSLLLLRSEEFGLGIAGIPLMYLVYSLSFVVFAIPFGRLADRVGERKVILGGLLSAVLAYLVIARADTLVALSYGFVLLGLYSAMTDGVMRAYVNKLVRPDQLATGEGFLGASLGVTSLVSGFLGGILWTQFSPLWAFNLSLIFMLIGLYTFTRFIQTAPKV